MYSIREMQGFLFLFSDKRYTGLVSLSGSWTSTATLTQKERERERERQEKRETTETEKEMARAIWKLIGTTKKRFGG